MILQNFDMKDKSYKHKNACNAVLVVYFLLQGLAVRMISEGVAPRIVQSEEGASYDAMLKKDLVKLTLDKTAQEIHDYIRGCDHSPGAWVEINGQVCM